MTIGQKKMPRASALAPQAVSGVRSLFINRVHKVDNSTARDDVVSQPVVGRSPPGLLKLFPENKKIPKFTNLVSKHELLFPITMA